MDNKFRPFDPDGTFNPAALDGFQPVGRISGDDFFAKRIAEGRKAILDGMMEAKAAEGNGDPMHRLADAMVDINDIVNRLFEPGNDGEPERIHGFKIGDRVQTKHTDENEVIYGHVVHVRRGCSPTCRMLCLLVHVNIFGTDDVVRCIPTQLEHID